MDDRTCERCGALITRRTNRGRPPKFCAGCSVKTGPGRIPTDVCRDCGTREGMDWWVGRIRDKKPSHATRCHSCYNAYARRRYRRGKGLPLDGPLPKTPPKVYVPRPMVACSDCGVSFKRTNQGLRCRPCSVARRRARLEAKRRAAGVEPRRQKPAPATKIRYAECHACGATFVARSSSAKFCGDACRLVATSRKCSQRIVDLYHAAGKPVSVGRAMGWREQIVAYLVVRDGGRCAICRKLVDISLPSGPRGDDRGPSIDHVIPRSAGGSDDLSNLRLTHWACNRARGNRGGNEQLRLVG